MGFASSKARSITPVGASGPPLVGEYLGCISVNDVIRGLHRTLAVNLGDNYIDELDQGNVSEKELSNVGFFFIGKTVR